MRIIGDELVSVSDEDIVNGTIMIPNNINKIDFLCFVNSNIEYIDIPDNITTIEGETFLYCNKLKKVSLPNNLNIIPSNCFQNCSNLTEIILGENITEIGDNAFSDCKKLEKVSFNSNLIKIGDKAFYNCPFLNIEKLPNSLVTIGDFAFSYCKSLEKIELPESLEKIGEFSFFECSNLKKIVFNSNIKSIGSASFKDCPDIELYFKSSLFDYSSIINMNKVFINDKEVSIEDNFMDIQKKELIDKIYCRLKENNYTYNLDKEKFTNLAFNNLNFMSIIEYLINSINYGISKFSLEEEIDKIVILYPKTRLSNFPNISLYKTIPLDFAPKFNYKNYMHLKNMDIFKYGMNSSKVIMDVAGIFGLFEDDKYVFKRMEIFSNISSIERSIDAAKFKELELESYIDYFDSVYEEQFILKDNVFIPDEYKLFLKRILNKYDIKIINNLNKRIGKQIRTFFVKNYLSKKVMKYKLKSDIPSYTLGDIKDRIYNSNIIDILNVSTLIRLFYNSNKKFNPEALEFIIKSFDIILHNTNLQVRVKDIIERYNEIKKFYNEMGNSDINIIDVVNYLDSYAFYNVQNDNAEFSILAKNAGISSQIHFEEYQRIYNRMKIRQMSSIPRIKREIKIDKYNLSVEILRKDDPLVLFIGEERYTNCCEKINDVGEECLRHAASEGRRLVVHIINEDGDKTLLAQSWVWRNGNLLCFDNIEGTNALKKNKIYQKLVVACYKMLTIDMIEYAMRNNDNIDVVTLGSGHSDVDLTEFFGETRALMYCPKNYFGYFDSDMGYYLYGNSKDVNLQPQEPKIYRDERIIKYEKGKQIKSDTIFKLKKIKNNPLSNYSNLKMNKYINVVCGEDWFIIYNSGEYKEIIDFGMINPTLEDEYLVQSEEIELYIKTLKEDGYKLKLEDDYIEMIYNQKSKFKKGI